MLHLPGEPAVEGDTCSWSGAPAGDSDLLSEGRSRVILRTLAPNPARITRRGGPGQEFWGHPYNPDAQYNHVLDRNGREQQVYRRPPYSPWRLEVEPPAAQPRDHFLHLLFVVDEGSEAEPAAERMQAEGRLGARIKLGARAVTVLFDTEGPLGGRLTISEGGTVLHDADL
jgi:hypothetical protein